MAIKIKDIFIKGYDRIIHATHEVTSLNCIISIHNTKLGPALGGVRSWSYKNFNDQLKDTIKLSEAMTLKNSICGINFGGGKATLNLNKISKTKDLYKSYAEVVESLKGMYITAGDVGTSKEDLIQCSKITKFVNGINIETSGPTAKGIFNAMKSANNFINKSYDLSATSIAISGVGKVGGKLAKLLSETGASIIAASADPELITNLKKIIKITEVNPIDLFKSDCDFISPCALGSAINLSNRAKLKCKGIIGGANNQLDTPDTAEWLFKNNILYCPDYLVNAGGVIAIACEINKSENILDSQLKQIGERLTQILIESVKNKKSTEIIAKKIALDRINK